MMPVIRRGLALTAVLGAIGAPAAMACHGPSTPPATGGSGAPCATASTSPSFRTGGYARHHRGDRAPSPATCTPQTPPPVTPPPTDPGTPSF